MKNTLYPWQEECLARWFANHGRGIVQAVTGSGKTLLALTAADRLEKSRPQELRIKIVVPTSALMRQWNRALKEFLAVSPKEIGLRGGGHSSPSDRKYMIYVINSARYELARQILSDLRSGASVLLIADECHHYTSGQNSLIFEFLPYIGPYEANFFSLGLSATLPTGPALTNLTSVLGRRIYSYGMEKAAAMHTVCSYNIFHIRLSFQPSERADYQTLSDWMKNLYSRLLQTHPYLKDMCQKERYEQLRILAGSKNQTISETAALYMKLSYKRKSLVCLASARLSCAFQLVKRLAPDEKILIFSERIRQAEELYTLLQKQYPGKVGRYHSQMGQLANQNALNRFRDNDTRILIACKALDEGVDVPDVSIGIVLSGTSMQRQRVQRLGRIVRKKEGKTRASLYYLHVEETAEDACFLPDTGNHSIFELEYVSETDEFQNPRYDRAARKLLAEMHAAGADMEQIKEAGRCLRLGSVRADWMADERTLDSKRKAAKYLSDQNYWICMKKLAQILRAN
ncbi:MAG: DEAD/DEAH box helicase [Eubacteriales bacterium]|nr:DEAD/DEAH box helicase [Eubacteriales bacterium]